MLFSTIPYILLKVYFNSSLTFLTLFLITVDFAGEVLYNCIPKLTVGMYISYFVNRINLYTKRHSSFYSIIVGVYLLKRKLSSLITLLMILRSYYKVSRNNQVTGEIVISDIYFGKFALKRRIIAQKFRSSTWVEKFYSY